MPNRQGLASVDEGMQTTRVRRLMTVLFTGVVVAFAVRPAAAHEIGTTQVTATLVPGADYRVDVVVDPDALLTKLEVFGDVPLSSGLTRADRDRRIVALRDVFLGHIGIRFDNVASRPQFEYVAASAIGDFAQAPSVVRLTGAT